MKNCRPCGKDKYWVNATTCEDCPAGSITDVMNGVPDVEGCKGMRVMFMHSTGVFLLSSIGLYVPSLAGENVNQSEVLA